MANIPTEILLDEILTRLPPKSLLRFKSTSQNFKTLISSPNFTNLHLITSANRLLIINLGSQNDGLHSYDLDSPKTRPEPVPFPSDFKPDPTYPIMGNCNGLLLIRGIVETRLLLINPCTRFCLELCFGMIYFSNYGLGYDNVVDDYKVVGIDGVHVMISSLREKKWRSVDGFDVNVISSIKQHGKNAVVIDNRFCHWLFLCRNQNKHRIVCFDICSERWLRDVPLPDYNCVGSSSTMHFADFLFEENRDKRGDMTNLGVLDGCLSVMTENTDLWVMKEYGVASSWVKLFKISEQRVVPLAYDIRMNSKVLCHQKGSSGRRGELIWYNARRNQTKKAEIHDLHGVGRFYEACVIKGSLVTLPVGKRILETSNNVD